MNICFCWLAQYTLVAR